MENNITKLESLFDKESFFSLLLRQLASFYKFMDATQKVQFDVLNESNPSNSIDLDDKIKKTTEMIKELKLTERSISPKLF